MKFFAVVFFLVVMKWTWGLVHETPSLSENVHVKIQQDMKTIISDYISENLPNSQNLTFDRFWTESLKTNKLKASFLYSFEDSNDELGAARVQVNGYAILNKTPVVEGKTETWSFDELYILDNKVEFKEGMQISMGDEPSEETPSKEDSAEKSE